MEDREEEHDPLAEPMHLRGAVHAADAVLAAGQQLRGEVPSVHTTRGWISSICFIRWPLQASISSGWGSRLPGPALQDVGHEALLAGQADFAEQGVEQLSARPTNGLPC